jgi:hypothetical protein
MTRESNLNSSNYNTLSHSSLRKNNKSNLIQFSVYDKPIFNPIISEQNNHIIDQANENSVAITLDHAQCQFCLRHIKYQTITGKIRNCEIFSKGKSKSNYIYSNLRNRHYKIEMQET